MGHSQHTHGKALRARVRRLGHRTCLRRGCGRRFQARRWNQRYCQHPECLRLLRRWQAAKRQQERRKRSEVRQARAAAERDRRARRRAEGRTSTRTATPHEHEPRGSESCVPDVVTGVDSREQPEAASHESEASCVTILTPSPHDDPRGDQQDGCAAATGIDPQLPNFQGNGGAWSRSKTLPILFCDRPGCYDAVRPSRRCRARYCSDECRRAIQRVRDRERKWLYRNTAAGQFKRRLEYDAAGHAPHAPGPTI